MIEHDYAKRFASIMLRMQKVIKAMEMADYTRIDEDL